MGVHSFWDIVGPTARPVKLESLQEKRMAVDASIWIYQFLKAMRDSEGNGIKNSHITGFFRRICKLLYFGIKPVFVFDGGVPALKKDTIKQRNERRQGKRDSARRTARKLLALQLHKESGQPSIKKSNDEIVFKPQDDWDLPIIEGFRVSKDDHRINVDYDTEKKRKKLKNSIIEETIDNLDLDSIDPTSEAFKELPNNIQYQILSNLRLKSRLRMGYSKEQLEKVFPDSLDFSKFQIDMVKRRNYYTQRIINMTGYHDGGASKLDDEVVNRISGQRDREYRITKTENGWTLGLGESDGSEAKRAILLESDKISNGTIDLTGSNKDNSKEKEDDEDEDEDEGDWEDVDLKPTQAKDTFDYSLKAGRLPELDKKSQVIGSQSFLDNVSTNISSKKNFRPNAYFKVQGESESENESNDNKKKHDDDDDYLKQIEEIEMMEAFQKSKMEQFQREKRINEEKEKLENKHEQDKIIETAKKQQVETEKKNKTTTATEIPTESEQNLNFIVGKIPNFGLIESQSLLFNDSAGDVGDQEEEKVVPETPSWFKSSTDMDSSEKTSNPFGRTGFVKDKENSRTEYDVDSNGYALLTGANAQYLLENELDSSKNDVTRIEPKHDIINISESEAEPEEEINDTEGKKVENEDAIDISEPHNKSTGKEGTNNPMVFDYEFSEDEEDDLVENIRKEEQDFNTFKNTELINGANTNQNVADTAFLEDELYQQQIKDKRDSDEVTPEMVTSIQDLLSQFGIPYITAPMEAEAQCAELLQLNLVDGIITDDSDVFLFGGTKIYKNIFHDRKYVEFYDSKKILVDLGIHRRNMIDLALLLGSDYTAGIKGMGPVSSMEIIAEFGDLTKFKEWYEEGQFDKEKLDKENKFEKDLRKRLVKNEVILDTNFPNELVVDAYMNPEVDHDEMPFVWGYPDLDMLRTFLQDHLGWPKEKSDEVLIPLIKDINHKKKINQRSINEFFPTEYIQSNNQAVTRGKRIQTATSKLKKRRTK